MYCNCTLCGVPITAWTGFSLPAWTSQYRVVHGLAGNVCISGLAVLNGPRSYMGLVHVPKDPALRWDQVLHPGWLRVCIMGRVSEDMAFVFHDACWSLLKRVPGGDSISLERLSEVCRSTPVTPPVATSFQPYTGFGWGHHHGGVLQRWPINGCPFHAVWEEQFIYNDDAHLTDIGALTDPSKGPELPDMPFKPPPALEKDCFSVLSLETRLMVANLVSAKDALSLCMVFPSFRSFLSDADFWKPRFCHDPDWGYLFELENLARYERLGDFQSLYHFGQQLVTSPNFLNRARIWRLAQTLFALSQPPSLSNLQREDRHVEPGKPWRLLRCEPSGSPMDPSNIVELRVPAGAVRVGISVINLDTRDYVTGIRLTGQDGQTQFAGYLLGEEENEKSIHVASLHGFRVAMGPRGVRALQVIGPDGAASPWAGRFEGVPISNEVVADKPIVRLRIRVDVYKITAMYILEQEEEDDKQELAGNPSPRRRDIRNTELWYPSPPPDNLLLNQDSAHGVCPGDLDYKPLSWIRFGGDRGQRLSAVRGLDHWRKYRGMGFQFRYDDDADDDNQIDRAPTSAGCAGHIAQEPLHFPINGSAGERIRSIAVGTYGTETFGPLEMRHIEITTNWGRRVVVGSEYDIMKVRELSYAPGTTITGIYGYFGDDPATSSIGVISERL